jgi:hypothetical protein
MSLLFSPREERSSCVALLLSSTTKNVIEDVRDEAGHYGATIFVTRPTLVSPAYRLSRLSIAQ